MTRPAAIFSLLLLSACHSHDPTEHLNTYRPADARVELATLAARSAAVHTVQGTGTVELTKPDGESVVLDAVAVLAPPDRVHLRATKLGHVVFDLTGTPGGLYLETGSSDREVAAGATAAEVSKGLKLLGGGYFSDPNLDARDVDDELLLGPADGKSPAVECRVDRRTLAPRQYRMIDRGGTSPGRVRFTFTLGEYATQAGVIWPRRMTAVSDSGTITLLLDDVTLNEPLEPTAFDPPPSAKRVP